MISPPVLFGTGGLRRQKTPPPRQRRGRAIRFLFTYSHSPLWASHHAGKAGSFGERVGFI